MVECDGGISCYVLSTNKPPDGQPLNKLSRFQFQQMSGFQFCFSKDLQVLLFFIGDNSADRYYTVFVDILMNQKVINMRTEITQNNKKKWKKQDTMNFYATNIHTQLFE